MRIRLILRIIFIGMMVVGGGLGVLSIIQLNDTLKMGELEARSDGWGFWVSLVIGAFAFAVGFCGIVAVVAWEQERVRRLTNLDLSGMNRDLYRAVIKSTVFNQPGDASPEDVAYLAQILGDITKKDA